MMALRSLVVVAALRGVQPFVTMQLNTDFVGLRSTFADEDAQWLPRGNLSASWSGRVYLPFRGTDYTVKLFRTGWPLFDFALDTTRDGENFGQTFIDSKDFAWGPAPGVNVSEWHRYTMSFDEARDELLFFIDGRLQRNVSDAGVASSDTAAVFSSDLSPTLWLGLYGEWTWGDGDVGELTLLSYERMFAGQYDEFALWDRPLAADDVAALAAGDAERREGVDAALALEPALLYDFSAPADADGAWPNRGAAGARYAMGAASTATGLDAWTDRYYVDATTIGELTAPVFANGSGLGAVTLANATYDLAENVHYYFDLRGRDEDGEPLRYVVVALPAVGAVYEIDGSLDVAGDRGDVRVTSAPWAGVYAMSEYYYDPRGLDAAATLAVRAETADGRASPPATFTLRLAYAIDDLPVARDSNVTTAQGVAAAVALNATDEDTAHVTYVLASEPRYGELYAVGADGARRALAAYADPASAEVHQYAADVHAVSSFWLSNT